MVVSWCNPDLSVPLISSPYPADKKAMELILDHTFETSDFLTWYCQAGPGDACTIIVPALQDWHLSITKTAEDEQLLLDPDGKRSKRSALDDLMRMLESMHRAVTSLVGRQKA